MTIRCEEFESMLADALGGELDEDRRSAFETHTRECGHCRADYDDAARTVSMLRGALGADVKSPVTVPTGWRHRAARRVGAVLLRYAAAIAIAFLSGYALRGSTGTAKNVARTHTPKQTLSDRFVLAYQTAPAESGFAQSLLAVMQHSDTGSP